MIYFDNSATTKPNDAVLETYTKVASNYFANPSSLHRFGAKSKELLDTSRKQIATMLGVLSEEIIFTSGGSEGNNLAIKGLAYSYKNRGNHIITSRIEHPSVRIVMEELESNGFRVTYLQVNKNGVIDLEELKAALTKETILISIMGVNNEVGSIQPLQEIGETIANREHTFFHVDFVQGIGKVPLEIGQMAIDLLTFSGHKFHALRGTGVLFKKKNVHLHPEILGGGQEMGYRSGTENLAGGVALAKALRLALENEQNTSELIEIRDYLLSEIAYMPDMTVHTKKSVAAPHIICFSAKGHRGEVLVHALEKEDIYISTTSACSSKQKLASSTLKAMGVTDEEATGAVRVSLSYENRLSEAKIFIQKLQEIIENLNKVVK
ncbi:cysteine desulfurase family protein [Listeria welshimeri]|uniref:Aminotransferase class-V family n=1 Tax=Listeria welshimeri serovar 6b (strain ATCC 35897 / DSM 20650 / CCUG 15529 / CIP 8149 / NCTC 11857 / SLCC 5334 / V8) TaxID=386043 RepID=A0AJ42_LISW6|nr:cysteine desulfurase family protein [Listeria welshimeri]MBC1252086.1 cysteine desulfurase [Listeria welshimeri]MBC1281526.1 cysteine desulfurase [Listeria welshimeri]MBC1344791.1 cysteine desulfurase [Listeria welshimeri]MBC1642655.1 cysteine desulfurase [Listeria welshimeri]MBC1697720.1 cysteine desulfurase [Listeria welshimeri]